MKHTDDALRHWLGEVGLHFDPFLPLDASQDSRLSEYRIGHNTFNAVWGDWVSFVFAPPGGGKTALRVNVAQSCWVGQGTNRPFPISYLPSYLTIRPTNMQWHDHLNKLSRAAARQLLMALVYRPHWLFALDRSAQRKVYEALDWNLPGPLAHYLDQCKESRSPGLISKSFDPTFQLIDPPDGDTLTRFCTVLEAFTSGPPPDAAGRWHHITDLLLNILGLQCLYILVDGLDAVYETGADPEVALASIADLLEQAQPWREQRIFVKGFFPSETRPVLERRYPGITDPERIVTIHWTPDLLAAMIKKRLYVASNSAFDSLNAVGSPALDQDSERLLAEAVPPLPREMLVLARKVITVHVTRTENNKSALEPEDFDEAIERYRQELPCI